MDKLLDKIIAFTYKDETIEPDRVEIVRYGLELFILKAAFLLASVIIALLTGEILSYLIFLIFFIPLRTLAGGYHAKTRLVCFIESMSLVVIVCFLAKLYSFGFMHIPLILSALAVPAIVLILVLSPVESNNKILSSEQKASFRIRIRIYIIIYVIAIALLLALEKPSYALSIALAVNSSAILVLVGYTQNKRLV